jgi:hypothetical protein
MNLAMVLFGLSLFLPIYFDQIMECLVQFSICAFSDFVCYTFTHPHLCCLMEFLKFQI